MKIAYVSEWNAYVESGVLRKIHSQAREWGSEHEVEIFLISMKVRDAQPIVPPDLTCIAIGRFFRSGASRPLLNYLNRVVSVPALGAALRRFRPELIYYRQGIWFPFFVTTLRRCAPYVVEINTSLHEARLEGWATHAFKRWGGGMLLRGASGIVCPTEELAQEWRKPGKPIAVVSNGFETRSVSPSGPPRNERPAIAFVGSADQAWHGVDKVVELAEHLPEFDFHVVGPRLEGGARPGNVHVHGPMGAEELAALYARSDVGIGTLALHRKAMQEAAPLKVREYLAYGLPAIVGYTDVDLKGFDCVLDIGNHESNARDAVERIRDFVQAWRDVRVEDPAIRAAIDSGAKERDRLRFLGEVGCGPTPSSRTS